METATILTREAFKNQILRDAEQVVKDHTTDYMDEDESHQFNSNVEFNIGKKLVIVEFKAWVEITPANFQGDYYHPADPDDVEIEIDEMEVSVTNDYEPLERLNEFLNQ